MVTLALVGIATGPSVAAFTVGIFFPFVDGRCAVIGNVIATAFTTWLSFGGLINKPYVYSYPVTTAGCNITDENLLADISSPVYDPSTWNPQSHYREGVSAMYDISYAWLTTEGFLLSIIISLTSSLILKNRNLVSKDLLASCVANSSCTPQLFKKYIDYGKDEDDRDSTKL
ncbi:hypothetical protein EB796_015029 [Bugula neritina]|uniref:Uncharacterized protein n=1 Tax=Bugula neritina TaxID=10212 RepID=A0A7J7JK30_BUGNE|nr:hypothetical protein EB796_015029 [Bugula neritina]